jgi:hypothetical protein
MASGDWSTVGGGENNSADGNGAAIGGGFGNAALAPASTVGGGQGTLLMVGMPPLGEVISTQPVLRMLQSAEAAASL